MGRVRTRLLLIVAGVIALAVSGVGLSAPALNPLVTAGPLSGNVIAVGPVLRGDVALWAEAGNGKDPAPPEPGLVRVGQQITNVEVSGTRRPTRLRTASSVSGMPRMAGRVPR